MNMNDLCKNLCSCFNNAMQYKKNFWLPVIHKVIEYNLLASCYT